ncbi:gliding motility-associated C-terminal domain-containing protein [Flavobacterium sp.]|uniref:T9SS type B sorting domain-containing protein n=1 Tax=Flavobacterium sp. TaxID=239 RepID=UPI002A81E2F0|nr:gliding motility-associated C-terminal domain-containing protein [Flavobacterium sp.]
MKKLLLVFLFFVSYNLFSQAGSSPCNALQLYPYTTCSNNSGAQYAGHYQSEDAAGNNVPMTGTSTLNPVCTTDNETTQSVRWISVTATTTSFTITNLTNYSGPGAATAEQRDYVVYSGPCTTLTQIACSASVVLNGTVNVTGLTAGQTYFIMVSQSAAAFSGYPTANAAATCITSTVPHVPLNDACANAQILINNTTYTSTNADSTADGPSVCQNPATGSVENNVWYQWCAPSNWTPGQSAFLNVNSQVCNSTQGLQLSIYGPGTTCAQISGGTATSLVCQNPGSTTNYNYTFVANPNQCYLINIDGFAGTACTYNIQVSASVVCATPPAAPTASVTVQPTCGTPTGTIVVTAPLGGTLQYSINDVNYQSSTTFTGVAPGTYNVTVRDTSTGCVSTATVLVVNAAGGAPAVPTITTTAPTCVAAGSSSISNYVGGITYIFTPSGPTVAVGGAISGMVVGTSYTVTAGNGSCSSVSSASFSNMAMLVTPAVPTASVTVQPTCLIPTGTVVVTAPTGSNLVYSIDNGVTYQASTTFSGLAENSSYTVLVSDSSTGCTSSPSSLMNINSIPASPLVTLTSGCNGANYQITASVTIGTASYEWFDSNSNPIGSTATVFVSSIDTYQVNVTVDNCTTTEYILIDNVTCIIPKGVSPNGDGLNDNWDLTGLNVNKAQIFNRYGKEVYSKSNYTNEWNGRTNNGNELPDATYYYVLSLPNGVVKTGWVYLNREN